MYCQIRFILHWPLQSLLGAWLKSHPTVWRILWLHWEWRGCGILSPLFSLVKYTRNIKEEKNDFAGHLILKGLFSWCVPWKIDIRLTWIRRCVFPPRVAQMELGPSPGTFSPSEWSPILTQSRSTPSLENPFPSQLLKRGVVSWTKQQVEEGRWHPFLCKIKGLPFSFDSARK